jgi:type IX secretion system PorP/SprF family membrane protein
MKSFLLSILVIISFAINGFSQQDPQFSHYMFNNMLTNPGYAGSTGKICATAINRNQWVGFGGGEPVTFAANVNAPFNLFGLSHGVGLSVQNDQWGFNTDLSLNLSYALRFDVGDGKLALGIAGGMRNHALDEPNWEYTDGSTFNSSSDQAIPQGEGNVTIFNMNGGVFYNTENLYLGISATNIGQPTLKYSGGETENAGQAQYQLKRHYYLTAGYTVQMPNPSFEVLPSVMVKSDGKSSQIDVNALLQYNKKFWGGVSLRVPEIAVLAGIELTNNLRIGVSYDYSFSKIMNYNNGTVEVMLNYCFEINKDKSPKKYKSIRYL